MTNIKIPGILWTLIIALAIWAIETFVPGAYQMYAEVAVVALMGAVKAFNLDDKQVEELLAVIRSLQAQVPVREAAFVQPKIDANEPNKVSAFLWG